jgi:hypothetical protein
VCLLIAAKFEETKPPKMSDLLKCVKLSDQPHLALQLETIILREVLHWKLSIATPLTCLESLIAQWNFLSFGDRPFSQKDVASKQDGTLHYNYDQVSIARLIHLQEILSLDLYLSTFNPLILSCAILYIYVSNTSEDLATDV